MEFIFSLLPVLLFLFTLYLLESFKLVSRKTLILCLIWGTIAAGLSYFINSWFIKIFFLRFDIFSKYLAPFTEEFTKIIIVIYLISRQKIGFAIDAAIYGFAAGAGFALAENMVYLIRAGFESDMIIWILRGFGTALMHGGCTSLFAMILIISIQRDKSIQLAIIPGFFAAYILHSLFNHFFLNAYLQTAMILVVLPLAFGVVFRKSASLLQNWLEIEFSSEIDLLRMIKQGSFSNTKSGNYLMSLKKYFSPEMILDLYCYISLYLELSVKAKRNLMLRESGFPVVEESDIDQKLNELNQIRRQIGKMGEMAIQPLVRMKYRELWKLNQLKN